MYLPFIFRILVTLIYLLVVKKINCFTFFIVIFLFDHLDCLSFDKECVTYEYQRYDKLADIITYILFLFFYGNIFNKKILKFLWILIIYRLIGVIKFFNNNDNTILHRYFDGVNSTVIISCFTNNIIYILLGLIFKYNWEKIHHKKNIQYK